MVTTCKNSDSKSKNQTRLILGGTVIDGSMGDTLIES